jgi:hypothetical protein
MKIVIMVTVSNDLKSTAVAKAEELLVHGLVADNAFVQSAVIMRGVDRFPDESTRQER